jgi:hypothetical protein
VNEGIVYSWDHDAEHSPPTYDNVYFIAESSDAFLNGIHFQDISAEVARALGRAYPKTQLKDPPQRFFAEGPG